MRRSDVMQQLKKADVVQMILPEQTQLTRETGLGFAPTNIALCKYWGKRDTELNLPVTSSLSIALPDKGALTQLTLHDKPIDLIVLNDEEIAIDSEFAKRTSQFLDLFRDAQTPWHVDINIKMNVPVAAGLASSACGFASLVCALNDLLNWHLPAKELSILARLGSGSAARSFWNGFVMWHAGVQLDGMDSFGEPLSFEWPELRIGLLYIDKKEKPLSSRDAMQRTVSSSTLYASWPRKVAQDMIILKQALHKKNFSLLAGTAESNSLSMHATMLSSWPPICYFNQDTLASMQRVWQLRKDGLQIYFTEDAGPNLKLLFLDTIQDQVEAAFPGIEVVSVFEE